MIYSDIKEVLQKVDGIDAAKIELLQNLTQKEIENIEVSADDLPKRLTSAAKTLRLKGEYPYYISKVIALWFASQKGEVAEFIVSNGIKDAVRTYCGIEYERELIQMVAEAFEVLPDLGVDDDKKIELMKKAYRRGDHYEKVNRGCAQCHMAAVSDVTGKEDLVMFRAANGFAAGMGLLGDGVCGGYSGGILSLGLFAGRRREFFDGDKEEKDLITKLVGKLHEKYIETYDSVICHDIHKDIFGRAFHITRPDEKVAFEEAGAHSLDKCPTVVATSAAWVAEILYDEGILK
ncbi:MAG: C-GCAxxG-C-C family protein [Spirochaetales bacterium]|nr:C-GCAxxG-C-C family protein [Spirochaetales bacterium]